MWRVAALAVVVVGWTAGAADALEVKNLRSTYGPVGSIRPGSKFLPGDAILLVFDIEGAKVDPEDNTVRYTVNLELFDGKKESLFKKDTPNQQLVAFGGTSITGYATVLLGTDQKPGNYSAKITVTDKSTKETGAVTFPFEILPADFGIIQPVAPAYGLMNFDYAAHMLIGGMARDAKKMMNVDVTIRVFDEAGKETLKKPLTSNFPKDLPEELVSKDYIPIPVQLYLTRPGVFRIEVEVVDRLAKNKTAKLSFPLKVVDPSAVK